MPAKLRPTTPWARDLLSRMDSAARLQLEAAVPDGYFVALSGKPPDVAAWLTPETPGAHSIASVYHQPSQWAAVYAVLVEGSQRVD